MKARTIARELALLLLFQRDQKGELPPWQETSFASMLVQTVRTLTELAQERIAATAESIADLRQSILTYEMDHPDNENIPVEEPTVPVPIPTTQAMVDQLDTLLVSIEQLEDALHVPELAALAQREDIENYCKMLVKAVTQHYPDLDRQIDAAATDWRVERLHKMDRTLLRLGLAELQSAKHVDPATVIDEILELAKQFTSSESRAFIHGILGALTAQPVDCESHV